MTRILLSILPVAAGVALGPVPARAPIFEPIRIVDARPPSVERLLVEAALRYELPVALLAHRAWMESRRDPDVPPNGDCYGLMQLNAKYFPGAEAMSLYDNIDAGAAYLKSLLLRCDGDGECAERAYRTGKVHR